MPYWNNLPLMKLTAEEKIFLRRWIYDEVHYRERMGPAKQLQLQHRVRPADLAILIAAGLPDPAEQEAASLDPPPEEPAAWPWSEQELQGRLDEARTLLGVPLSVSPLA